MDVGLELKIPAFTVLGRSESAPLTDPSPISMFKQNHPLSDTELFERFLRGDNAAFYSLFTSHNQKIFNYCVKLLEDVPAAQDITQTTWERFILLRNNPQAIQNVGGFLIRVARNLSLDHIKHARYQMPLQDLSDSDHPYTIARETSEKEELVLQALKELPQETQDIFILNFYSGYTYEEIAQMLGKTPNAIWTRVSRAKEQLRTIVEKKLQVLKRSEHNTSETNTLRRENYRA